MENASMKNEPQTIMAQATRDNDTNVSHITDQTRLCSFCGREISASDSEWEDSDNFAEILFKALKAGRLRGVVAISSCTNEGSPSDPVHMVHMVRELTGRDILVFVAGCISADLNDAGLMEPDSYESVGEGLKEFCGYLDLAPVLSATSGSGSSCLDNFVGELATLAGAESSTLPLAVIAPDGRRDPQIISLSCDMISDLDVDPVKAADSIDSRIHNKRLGLAWCDQFHCKIHS